MIVPPGADIFSLAICWIQTFRDANAETTLELDYTGFIAFQDILLSRRLLQAPGQHDPLGPTQPSYGGIGAFPLCVEPGVGLAGPAPKGRDRHVLSGCAQKCALARGFARHIKG